jgi:hypothetical protein
MYLLQVIVLVVTCLMHIVFGTVNVALSLHEVNYHHKKVFWRSEDSAYY